MSANGLVDVVVFDELMEQQRARACAAQKKSFVFVSDVSAVFKN